MAGRPGRGRRSGWAASTGPSRDRRGRWPRSERRAAAAPPVWYSCRAAHRERVGGPVGDPGRRGPGGGDRGEARHPVLTLAARRMWAPSARGPRPRGVLTTSWTLPDGDQLDGVDAVGSAPPRPPWRHDRVDRHAVRPRGSAAVPAVAASGKPSSTKRRAAPQPAGLSRSASDKNTVPAVGESVPRRRSGSWRTPARRCGRCP